VRLFAGDRIKNIMNRFKLPDDEPMEAKILSNQIEGAQKKVEEQNSVMRKNVLKYDDVMNTQRQVIYEQRRRVLEGEDLSGDVEEWIREVIENTVDQFLQAEYSEEWDIDALVQAMQNLYGTDMTAQELRDEVGLDRDKLVAEFVDDALDEYAQREQRFGAGEDETPIMRELERFIILQIVDTRWREHLESMDYMREGIHLRSFAQKDPLVEYRHEGHLMFEQLGREIREEVVFTLFHAEIAPQEAAALDEAQRAQNGNLSYGHETAAGSDAIAAAGASSTAGAAALGTGGSTSTASSPRQVVASDRDKIGRNDPCWCGSGKKFKKCHGA